MTERIVVGLALQAVVTVLAALLARRRSEHRPIVVFAAVTLAADVARGVISLACPWIWQAGPWAGARRAVFHLDQVLFLAWPVGVAATAWAVYLRRRPWLPLAVGGAVQVALVIGYPGIRAQRLGQAYAAFHLLAVVGALACSIAWARHREPPRPEHAAALLIALVQDALLAGPYRPPLPEPFDGWLATHVTYFTLWGALLVLHAAALWGGFLGGPRRARG